MSKTCFMIVSYSEEFGWIHRIAQDAFERHGYTCIRPDRNAARGNFMDEVGEGIRDADVVYVDITGDNPNVFYELGVAHALHKLTVVVKQLTPEGALNLPADLRGYKVIGYTQKAIEAFVDALKKVSSGH